MSSTQFQNLSNHAVTPVLLVCQVAGYATATGLGILSLCFPGSGVATSLLACAVMVAGVASMSLAMKTRFQMLTLQDRIIRLEMRLRLEHLAPEDLTEMDELALGQLVALRFASDEELPGLARQALDEKLGPLQIKQRVKRWQADFLRV